MATKLLTVERINGVLVPSFMSKEELDKLKDVKLFPDDVWIVTYPKCGTTWTQQIVRLIRNNGKEDDVKLDIAISWPGAAIPTLIDIEKLPRPRAFKSHHPYDLFPCGPPHTTPCKYIYVVRNPKDVAVSYFHMLKQVIYPGIDWDSYWKKYITGDLFFGNFFDHILSWLPHKDDENVLFLKYEDMKRDLQGAVSQIASFLGADLSSDVIAKIAALTSFETMKKDDTANYSWIPLFELEGGTKFMRKGVVGDWKHFLTAEQSTEMDAICAERLKGTGLDFLYEQSK